jgi:hypothetical protein
VFQVLAHVFFGALTKLKAGTLSEFDDDSTNMQITKLIQTYMEITLSSTIRESVRKAGLELDTTSALQAPSYQNEMQRKTRVPGDVGAGHCRPNIIRRPRGPEIWNHQFRVSGLIKCPRHPTNRNERASTFARHVFERNSIKPL